MRVVSSEYIRSALSERAIVNAVRQAFIDHANGCSTVPNPMQLLFHEANGDLAGDCHVKAAARQDCPIFVIKIATGFYKNAARSLPVNGGAVMVMDAVTGAALALLDDGGALTSWRTAAAGVLAAQLACPSEDDILAIAGTGHQALLQARWICQHLGLRRVRVWGRAADKAAMLQQQLTASGLIASTAVDIQSLCMDARILVTATPATEPFVTADQIAGPLHIVALGADSPGKSELSADLFRQADLVITDDHQQCLDHGDFGNAVRHGAVCPNTDIGLGTLLADKPSVNLRQQLSIVDLTGLGIQDLALAELIWASIGRR